ncbi:MAG: ABC transporter substrate-binding protein [Hyphomicrobiales bacterium]|nr:MAG: ABC transporter substrate-binding protein [Hyphomicrobiales bacterium]
MQALGRTLRRILDALYTAGGIIAALCLIMILIIIVLQMSARWTGQVIPGSTDYAGYFMAAASFFAFAHALNHGAHIRVSILLNNLGKYRFWGELWCFGIGTALSTYFAWYAVKAVYWSRKLNDISQGQDATPIWIPQMAMAIGTCLLALAFADHLFRLIFAGSHGIKADTVEQSHGE